MKFDLMDISGFETAEEARDFAISYQQWESEQSLSYGELSEYQTFFRILAERFGLVEEFIENGLI